MAINIRKANLADADEIECLYNELIDHLVATTNYPGWRKGVYPTREDAVDGINEEALYVAESESHIVGTIILRHKPEPGYKGAAWKVAGDYDRIYVVYTLAVHPHYLGQGVGEQLLLFAEQLARKENNVALRLDVVKGNKPATRLYKKCGYEYIDTVSLGYEAYGLPWYDLFEKKLL